MSFKKKKKLFNNSLLHHSVFKILFENIHSDDTDVAWISWE